MVSVEKYEWFHTQNKADKLLFTKFSDIKKKK